MNPEIEQLKELVRQNIALAQETNQMLHSMRRGAWLSRGMHLLWIAVLVGASLYTYMYLQPYIDQLLSVYADIQGLQEKASGFLNQPQSK